MTPQEAYDSIPKTLLEAMKPQERMNLQNRVKIDSAGKEVLVGDKNVFRDAKRWIRANPERAENTDFQNKFLTILEDGQIDKLYELAGKGKAVLHNEKEMLDRAKLRAGINLTEARKPDTEDFRNAAAIEDFVESNMVGTNGTPADFKEVTDRATIEIITSKSYLPGVGDKVEQAWRYGQPGGPFIEGIPANEQHMIDEYAAHIVGLGLEPTVEHVQIVSMLVENNKEAVRRRESPQEITKALVEAYSKRGQHDAVHEAEDIAPTADAPPTRTEAGLFNFPLNPKYK
jgi:hypothetical protein